MNKSEIAELDTLVHEFPVGDTVQLGKDVLYIMGYYGCDQLILANKNPEEDYDEAIKSCWSYNAHLFRRKH